MTNLIQIANLFAMIFKPFQAAILMALPIWYVFFTVWSNTNIFYAVASFWGMIIVSGVMLFALCQLEAKLDPTLQ